METTRQPAVAGSFYPTSAKEIQKSVEAYLENSALPSAFPDEQALRGLIVPHAGYIYSGLTAAHAYRCLLDNHRDLFNRVVLLGPSHRAYLNGIAIPKANAFSSPLGEIAIDSELRDLVRDLPFLSVDDVPHALEHSLEVQLPFLQMILRDFTLFPAVFGQCTEIQVFEFLDRVIHFPQTLVVISTDLSHFHSYEKAKQIDSKTLSQIQELKSIQDPSAACGGMAVNGWLRYAREHGLKPHLLDYRNSGDTAGSKQEVVGYCAFAFTQ